MPVRSTPRPWDALVWLAALTTSLFVYSFFGAVDISELPPLPAKAPAAAAETEIVLPDPVLGRPPGAGGSGGGGGLPHGSLKPEPEFHALRPAMTARTPVGTSALPHPAAQIRPERPDEATPLPPRPAPLPSQPSPPPPADPPLPGDAAPAPAPSLPQASVVEPLAPTDALDGAEKHPKHRGSKRRDGERPPPHAHSEERQPPPAPVAALVPAPDAESSPPSPPAAEPERSKPPGKAANEKEKKGA